METKLIFVRHGEAAGNIERVFHGFTNSALTERGRLQVERLGEHLSTQKIDHVYASDLIRAYETAKAVAKHHNLSVEIDSRFREINGGKWENVPWDALPLKYPESYRLWLEEPHGLQMPEGESMVAFADRLIDGVEDILKKHAGQTICIATHGTAIRVLNCYCQGRPLTELTRVRWCDNAATTVAIHDEAGLRVVVDGDNSYLLELSIFNEQTWWRD